MRPRSFDLKFDCQTIAAVRARISKFGVEAVISAFDRIYNKYGPEQLLYEDILKCASSGAYRHAAEASASLRSFVLLYLVARARISTRRRPL
jgi:hypothetical protein